MRAFSAGLVVLAVLSTPLWGQAPAGTEFPVNTYTTGNQRHPSVGMDGSGAFVVVWESYGQDGSGYGVFGRRFNASSAPLGTAFPVNTYTTGSQDGAAVANDANGNFVVVWTSYGQDGSSLGIFGQRFSAAGGLQGNEFLVNSHTTNFQARPSVASDASGNFVVVWVSPQDGGYTNIFGQRFSASGVRLGTEFRVNSYSTGNQTAPAVASDSDGNFVVVWHSPAGNDGDGYGVFGQRYNASGVPQGTEFQINSYTTGSQLVPAVASDGSGNFVAVWVNPGGRDGSSTGVFGRRFNASGVSQGDDFQVNSYTTELQNVAHVASHESGNFVVVWQSWAQDGSNYGVFGQRFNSSGVRQGTEFRVNTYVTGRQDYASIAARPDGRFVVVWTSGGQDGSSYGVFGQRYDDDLIFEDGFESSV